MPRKEADEPWQSSLFETAAEPVELPPAESLADVLAAVAERRCAICREGDPIVFGDGNPEAELVWVGESPSPDDELTGRPFSGPSGQLLDKMIAAIGYRREDCYLCNVIKCRVRPGHVPEREEIESCRPYLLRQIAALRPRLIVALGGLAAQTILNTKAPISRLRGRLCDFHGIKVMPTFNPAYLLRVPEKKREVWEDLKTVRDYLKGTGS